MKYYEKVKELIDHEISDIPCFNDNHKIEFEEVGRYEYYRLSVVGSDGKEYSARFRTNELYIEVEIGDSIWEQIEYYTPNIKYFWIALLS